MGDERWEMEDGRWKMEDGRWEMGDGRWEMIFKNLEFKKSKKMFAPLYEYLPIVAETETRSIKLFSDENDFNLPSGNYAFVELFCTDKKCDCRRVMFTVIHEQYKHPLAVIGYGWETLAFYKKWMHTNDTKMVLELTKPILNDFSEQSIHAKNILKMFNKVLMIDKAYLERIKNHYKQMRSIIK